MKSSAIIEAIDVGAERLGYFHNAGLYELSGDDCRGSLLLDAERDETHLPPYIEAAVAVHALNLSTPVQVTAP